MDMNHVGRFDSHDGDEPFMRTCVAISGFQDTSLDDEAKVLHEYSAAATLNANFGFEEMATSTRPMWWRVHNLGGVTYDDTTDSHHGNRGFSWDVGSNTGAYFHQTVRLTDLGRDLVVRASIKKTTSSSTVGFVYARMWTREVEFTGVEPCSYPDVTGDQNNPTTGVWVWTTSARESPTTSWVNHDFLTAADGRPATFELDAADAVDVQVRFQSSVRLAGTNNYVEIRFDNARARFY
jgi:hypothetical protein